MVSREADRCLGGILVIVIFGSFSGAATLFSQGTMYGIIGGVLLGALGVGGIIFFIAYSIRFYQAKARGQSPYTKGSLMPRSSPEPRPVIMHSAIPVRIQPQPRVSTVVTSYGQ